jgi:hypothetical protein
MRDALEQADHDLWAAIPADDDTDAAAKRCAGRSLSTGGGAATKASWQELRQKAGRRASCDAPRLFHLHGDPDRRKPFSGPGFEAERRASVPSAWPKNRITKASALDGLNDEARAILMAIIETGAPCERDLQSRARSHLRRCGNPVHPHH